MWIRGLRAGLFALGEAVGAVVGHAAWGCMAVAAAPVWQVHSFLFQQDCFTHQLTGQPLGDSMLQVDNFRRQFDHLDNGGQGRPPGPNLGQATSLPRERVREFQHEAARYMQQVGAATLSALHAVYAACSCRCCQNGREQ